MHALVVEHERTRALLQHSLDPNLLHRVVTDPQPTSSCPRPCRIWPLVIAYGAVLLTPLTVATERTSKSWRSIAMVSSGWWPGFAAETDVVSEGVLTVVTYNRREAVERTRHGVRRGSRS